MTTGDQTKIDAFRAKIEQRKACEKKAFTTCMELIEADKVDNETLINAAILIDQERYRGVNEDRSLSYKCGYPICPNLLPKDIPTHQYHINVKVNKVTDTTERRFFCSTFCYKASKYFERQIPTSPVWAREHETANSLKIELLTHENLKKEQPDNSTIISQSNYIRSRPTVAQRRDSSSSASSSDDEFEKLQIARDEYYKSRATQAKKPTLVETKLKQSTLPDYIRTDNTTIDFVIACLYEWLNDKTRDYLQNDTTTSIAPIDPHRFKQLVNKLDADEMMSSEGGRAEKKLPAIKDLQRTTLDGQYELKVQEFFFGKELPLKEEAIPLSAIALPPVDAYSQQTIRLSIVSEKTMTCFKQMFNESSGQSIIRDLRITLSELLLTLNYGNENITLKPNEWTIMTLFLVHLLTNKLPMLLSNLNESKIIQSLLNTLNLSSDMIFHIVKYLLEHPIENQETLKSQTNFEEMTLMLIQRTGQTVLKDLLDSDVINIKKIKQYAQKNTIVTEFKPLCWKVLLGIKSPYRSTRRYVDQANCDIYKRLHETLTTCRIIQPNTPISQQFLSMYLIDTNTAKLPLISTKEFESFLSIANFICSFLDNDNEQRLEITAECWFMTCKIYDKFIFLTRRIALLRYHVEKYAPGEFSHDPKLLLHINTHNIFACIPDNWLKDGFQLITDDISLLNIWEKFLAGSECIFIFLTIQILHHCRLKLLSLYTTKEIMQYLTDLKIVGQADCEHIVIASIASWKKNSISKLDFAPIPS